MFAAAVAPEKGGQRSAGGSEREWGREREGEREREAERALSAISGPSSSSSSPFNAIGFELATLRAPLSLSLSSTARGGGGGSEWGSPF